MSEGFEEFLGGIQMGHPRYIPDPGDDCEPCDHDAKGFYCTRPPGHYGDHAAHSDLGVMVARWPQ